jgi:sphingomyelin phosphodiesterase 2
MLRAVTLNVWGLSYATDRDERIHAVSAKLSNGDYDLVGLQEVWVRDDLEILKHGAYAGGLTHYHYFPSGVIGSGLVVFCRYPIIDARFLRYRLAARKHRLWHGAGLVGKGIGLVRIQTPVGVVDVYNTHTLAQYIHDDEADEYRAARAAQLYEATRFMQAHTTVNPVIAMGDFNMQPHQIGYRMMTTLSALTDCYYALHPDNENITFSADNQYVKNHPSERLDYVFVRDGKSLTVAPTSAMLDFLPIAGVPPVTFSDHYGVAVDLQITQHGETEFIPPSQDNIHAVLSELHNLLAEGYGDALRRYDFHRDQLRMSALSIVPVSILRRNLNLPVRILILPLLIAYTFIQAWIFGMALPDEMNSFQAIRDEVGVHLKDVKTLQQ